MPLPIKDSVLPKVHRDNVSETEGHIHKRCFGCASTLLSADTRVLLWFFPLIFLGIFFFYPLIRIFALSLRPSVLLQADTLRIAYNALSFTFYQAILSTLITLLLGLPSAYLFARYDFFGKPLLRALSAVPFMLPTVVVAAGFNALLGPRGWLTVLLHPFENSEAPLSSFQFTGTLTAILVAHVFYNTTIVIRIVGNAISRLDPKLEQTARSLGADARRVWWYVTLPLLRPSIVAASLLVFLFDFTSFGVILLLGGPGLATLEVEIYLQSVKYFNLSLAALLSLIQLLCTLIFSVIYTRVISRSVVQTAPRSAESNLHKPKSSREKLFVASAVFLLSSFFVLPLLALPLRSITRLEADRGQRGEVQTGLTADYYSELFINRRDSVFYVPPMQAALNSLLYASGTVVLSLILGFPAASALAKPTRLGKILDPILMLPLGASAVTLGLGFIVSYGRLLTNPLLVPLAHTLVALPFVIRTLQPAIASIPERLRQAAVSLGASPFRVWQTVDWQILRRATLSAATFAFTISLGEFGATLLISRPDYPTIPVAIERFLSQPGGLNYGQAMAMATLLMLLTAACILIIEKLRLPGAGEF
jgi:thiamine transport system permease protein